MTTDTKKTMRRARARHFLTGWLAAFLMLTMLAATFAAGAVVLYWAVTIALDPNQSFGSPVHPWVAGIVGLAVTASAAWLFGLGVLLLKRVFRASRELALTGEQGASGQTS